MDTYNKLLRQIAIVLGLLILLALTSVAHAQEPAVTLGIKPVDTTDAYFSLEMAPGERRVLTVELGNYGDQTARARTYAADDYTIINGGFGAKLDGEPTSGVTRWLDYTADTIELAPRTGINRSFTIQVPADTQPGDFITSIVIQGADLQTANSEGIGIQQVVRQVIAVAVTVPGQRTPSLTIDTATHRTVTGNSLIAVAVRNTGNIHLRPSGDFVIRDTAGNEISRYPIVMDTVYAGTTTFVEVPFSGRINPGDYTVSLALADSERHLQLITTDSPLTIALETQDRNTPIGSAPRPASINQPATLLSTNVPGILGICGLVIIIVALGMVGFRRLQRGRRGTL
jgi:hypothetical protein